ncbi:BatA domain-containing protein [Stieleria sp. JC731]|uniref:BatA domain-containing protein n=1 Tax=Pirellulaceae TaxID=2691357 RepID=UPI001E631979|nr:BatA domain-containing protein [Stieleria sp. JC731]MCC9601647.1 BatA domain-containing protein [Stieleria sp. JC731]
MSFLTPLYFLGALAVVGPILFHLIRRQPKGEVQFSSLMFLEASPPRLTRRSRLENLPLLLIRCLAIGMLAFAFARPFLPSTESESIDGVQEATIILVDQSASMRRVTVADQIQQIIDGLVDQCDDDALIALIAFDQDVNPVLSLQESAGLQSSMRKSAAKDAAKQIEPTWLKTDIGKALRYCADSAALLDLDDNEGEAESESGGRAAIRTRIVLVSDLQSGAAIDSLQGYDWPADVWLETNPVSVSTSNNASLRVIPRSVELGIEQESSSDPETVRVEVRHDDGVAGSSTFQLRFHGQESDAAVVQVGPGQTRYFNVPLPPSTGSDSDRASAIELLGDSETFDNSHYFIRPQKAAQQVLFVASEKARGADQRQLLSFYLSQLPFSDSTREVTFEVVSPNDFAGALDVERVPLVIVPAKEISTLDGSLLDQFVSGGGHVLFVLDDVVEQEGTPLLSKLLDSPKLEIEKTVNEDFRLISSVDFESPLIRPLSEPGVNDFSTIKVWNHFGLSGTSESVKTTLRLDDGSPWLLHRQIIDSDRLGGQVWVLTSGWQPSQSQFGLSTKFVPMMLGMLGPNPLTVSQSVAVGTKLGQGDDEMIADSPGIVTTNDGVSVAVNLDASESMLVPIDADRFGALGVTVSSPELREQDQQAARALRDVELEARQGWWQWLILATMGLVAIETILSSKGAKSHE